MSCYIAGLTSLRGWIVWERQESQSAFSHAAFMRPSTVYEEMYLPFFDSYAQVCNISWTMLPALHPLLLVTSIYSMDDHGVSALLAVTLDLDLMHSHPLS